MTRTTKTLWAAFLIAVSLAGNAADETNWSPRELRILTSLRLAPNGLAPRSLSNRVADHDAARQLGARLFFDTRLSGNGKLSCASCHLPAKYFTDGLRRSQGIGETLRNAPTVVGTAYLSWFYWDGRRDSLWAQALIPIEAADEMGGSRLAAIRLLGTDTEYRELYQELFGEFPDALLDPELPEHAGPFGSSEIRDTWYRLPQRLRNQINLVYSKLGKVIAAYERTLVPQPTRFDSYVAALMDGADSSASSYLSPDEIAGAKLFIDEERMPCLQCHNGPLLTNGGFHNIGTGNFEGERLDFGRIYGLRAVLMDEFNCLGPYSDANPPDCLELNFLNKDSHIPLEGAFKVPSLRQLTDTAPYFHDGRFESLEEVVGYYRTEPGKLQPGSSELTEINISEQEAAQLISFLQSLSDSRASDLSDL